MHQYVCVCVYMFMCICLTNLKRSCLCMYNNPMYIYYNGVCYECRRKALPLFFLIRYLATITRRHVSNYYYSHFERISYT